MSGSNPAVAIDVCSNPEQIPEGWETFVNGAAEATIFHSSIWQGLIGSCYPYQFLGLRATGDDGKTLGVLPLWLVKSALTGKRMISAPFSYVCPPLALSAEVEAALVEKAIELCREHKAAYYEMKSPRTIPVAETTMAKSGQFETFLVDLHGSEEEIWGRTHKGMIQRGVNKARKEGVTVRVGAEEACVREFHRLNLLTCRKHGIPAQSLAFHQEVWRRMTNRDLAEFLFADYQGRTVAAVVIFYFNGTAIYMYGASDEAYLAMRPNHLLIWEAMLRAKSRGMHTFDLGRVSDDNPGLKEFKQRWGAVTVPLHYYYWPEKRGVGAVNRNSLKFKATTFMFSKMPLFVTGRLTWLYKHLA